MINIDGKVYRNLEEQVRRNTQLLGVLMPVLQSGFLTLSGVVSSVENLPKDAALNSFYLVGTDDGGYDLYIYAGT